jgi:NAD-dependent deacetylase
LNRPAPSNQAEPPLPQEVAAALELAADRLRSTQALLVLTGAGVSVESGLPTYRGPGGVYEKFPDLPSILTAEGLVRERLRVWQYIDAFRVLAAKARANAAHRVLARWEQEKRFRRFLIATQNIDGLHQAAGSTRVTQLHGSVWQMAQPRETEYTEDARFGQAVRDFLSGSGREAILRQWSEENEQVIWEDREVPFHAVPPYQDPAVRPNVLFFDECYGTRRMWVDDFIRAKPDTVLVVGCSGVVAILGDLIRDCRAANPACGIINVNAHDDPIRPPHLHVPLSATAGLAALDAAL